jgi:hypothetical protein
MDILQLKIKMTRKVNKTSSILRCKIKPSSNEEVVLNYLSMRWRARKPSATIEEIFDLAPNRFKKIEIVSKALQNLVTYKYASSHKNNTYSITDLGYRVPYILAEHRRSSKSAKIVDED